MMIYTTKFINLVDFIHDDDDDDDDNDFIIFRSENHGMVDMTM